MKLYVARHGQTQMNADNQVCGRTDIPLTELGLQQAQQLADNARGKKIDIIIVSPNSDNGLTRAGYLAEPFAAPLREVIRMGFPAALHRPAAL